MRRGYFSAEPLGGVTDRPILFIDPVVVCIMSLVL